MWYKFLYKRSVTHQAFVYRRYKNIRKH